MALNSQNRVAFTQMKDGSKQDYELLRDYEHEYCRQTADRLIETLARQGQAGLEGYQVSRLDHALQSASRAEQDGADMDWIVAALLHDIGDELAPQNHDRMAAEIIRPFVRWEVSWVIEHHGLFQTYYYGHHYGWDRNARDEYRDHPCFHQCVEFCERWDQASFDPHYPTQSLEYFAPMVQQIFSRQPHDPAIIQEGKIFNKIAV